MTNSEMLKMRAEGATLTQIAEKAGISRQAVDEAIKRLATNLANGKRGHRLYVSEIKFQGFYDYFKENPKETISSFTRKVYGNHNGTGMAKLRAYITGKGNSYFTIPDIKKICEIIGKPFEEVFKEREGK